MPLVPCAFFACNGGRDGRQQGTAAYRTDTVTLSSRTLRSGYTATIRGYQTVEIRPQVSGQITDIRMKEGDAVRKDSVLFVIDQVPYKAAHDIAVANVKSAEAVLSTARLVWRATRGFWKKRWFRSSTCRPPQRGHGSGSQARIGRGRREERPQQPVVHRGGVAREWCGEHDSYRVGVLVSSTSGDPLVTCRTTAGCMLIFSECFLVSVQFFDGRKSDVDMIQRYGSLKHAIEEMLKWS